MGKRLHISTIRKRGHRMKGKTWLAQGISILLYGFLFLFLFQYDNKYETPAPYGNQGVYEITSFDAQRYYFLIDDWVFYENELIEADTPLEDGDTLLFLGQYPNFQLMERDVQSGSYRMQVKIEPGIPTLFLQVPEIFSTYRFLINGEVIPAKNGDLLALEAGNNDIIIQVPSSSHYYSGVYYPPVVGSASAIAFMNRVHDTAYLGIAMFAFLGCAFMFFLKRNQEGSYFPLFAKMAACFGLYMLYPFYHSFSDASLWYCVEDFFYYASIAYCLRLAMSLIDHPYEQTHRVQCSILTFAIPCFCVFSTLVLLPAYPSFVSFYGGVLDGYKGCFCIAMLYCAYRGFAQRKQGRILLLQGGLLYGFSILINHLFNNMYEPIYGLWQGEYAMVMLLILCFFLVIMRFRRILQENEELNYHLERMVEQRTNEISMLLKERKTFFSNMAHDLKAPTAAIQMYIEQMRENGLYIDDVMTSYLSSMERKNKEMMTRLSDLNDISAVDKITDAFESVSLHSYLKGIYQDNLPESDVMGIHFTLLLPKEDVMLSIVKRKMSILFENIFYNSLSFSKTDTTITLSAEITGDRVILALQDEGCGMEDDVLAHIFDRYYSARQQGKETSGLGLAIVKMIALEMHGDVWATSKVQEGTTIFISLPYTKLL